LRKSVDNFLSYHDYNHNHATRVCDSILSSFMNLSVHYARPVVAYLVETELVLL